MQYLLKYKISIFSPDLLFKNAGDGALLYGIHKVKYILSISLKFKIVKRGNVIFGKITVFLAFALHFEKSSSFSGFYFLEHGLVV
jgi:hypothetical protein